MFLKNSLKNVTILILEHSLNTCHNNKINNKSPKAFSTNKERFLSQ